MNFEVINPKNIELIEPEEYTSFVEKFKHKKTTDDCYTPPAIYNAVVNWVTNNTNVRGLCILRPFYPGEDYERINYQENDVVIDNPPFSIISKIARFYIQRKIKFFLFAPHLTLFSSNLDCCHIVCGANIIYENGAVVITSFFSNLFEDYKIITAPSLYDAIRNAQVSKEVLPKYSYPSNLITVTQLEILAKRGVEIAFHRNEIHHIRSLKSQHQLRKAIFGSGFLISDKAAADKAAADKAAADKANVIVWELSEEERNIINQLNNQLTQ